MLLTMPHRLEMRADTDTDLLLKFSGYITALIVWGINYGNVWQLQLQH